jgi:hypothetical protein
MGELTIEVDNLKANGLHFTIRVILGRANNVYEAPRELIQKIRWSGGNETFIPWVMLWSRRCSNV